MYDPYYSGMPWKYFMDFISPDAGRFGLLEKILSESSLPYSVLSIAGNSHFIITSRPDEEYLRRPPVMLTAHYDRSKGSPGANDNSAGVFLLLETAIKLIERKVNNWIVVFTDKEELEAGESIEEQGSYSLAASFKNTGLENSKVYCFDACGTGDTMIFSTTAEYLLKKDRGHDKLKDAVFELRSNALNTARNLGMAKVLLAPSPFSDDAGFLKAGMAAQTITMLPSAECLELVSALRKNPDYTELLINAGLKKDIRSASIPETWRCLNSPSDSHLRLTPKTYRLVVRFAEALCRG